MDLNLMNRQALVTGASAGLGFAAARALLSEGADVIINSRSEERLREAADRLVKEVGRGPEIVAGDLADEAGRRDVVLRVRKLARNELIDILVSNAGGPPPGAFLDHDPGRFEDASKLVLDSAVDLTRAFLPKMIENKWGRLIYITSVGVLQPVDTLILSNTYRAAVTGFCKTISNNYAKHGITANCVCPGYTATERLNELAENLAGKTGESADDILNGFAQACPARRLGQPHELAALIAFLSSDLAGYISGASIPVDGGHHKALL